MSFFTKEECETFACELREGQGVTPKAEEILQKIKELDGDILAQVKANHELSSEVGGPAAVVSKALVTAVQHVSDNGAPEDVKSKVLEIITIEFMTAQMELASPETGPVDMWLSTEVSDKDSAIKGLYWHNQAEPA